MGDPCTQRGFPGLNGKVVEGTVVFYSGSNILAQTPLYEGEKVSDNAPLDRAIRICDMLYRSEPWRRIYLYYADRRFYALGQ